MVQFTSDRLYVSFNRLETNKSKIHMSLQAKPLNTNKFTTYHVENPGSGMEQVHKCAGGKPVNGIPSSQPQPFDDWILKMAIQIYIIKNN